MSSQRSPEGRELTSEELRRQGEIRSDRRKVAAYLGIPAALLVAALATDCGIDEINKHGLVQNTRSKAEQVANGRCKVDSFGPRDRFRIPGRRKIEYECHPPLRPISQLLDHGYPVICESDAGTGKYVCRDLTHHEKQKRSIEKE